MRSVSISEGVLRSTIKYLELLLTMKQFQNLPQNRKMIVEIIICLEKALAR